MQIFHNCTGFVNYLHAEVLCKLVSKLVAFSIIFLSDSLTSLKHTRKKRTNHDDVRMMITRKKLVSTEYLNKLKIHLIFLMENINSPSSPPCSIQHDVQSFTSAYIKAGSVEFLTKFLKESITMGLTL